MQANTAGALSPYDDSTAAEIDEVVDSFLTAVDVPEPVSKEFSELMTGILSKAESAENEAAIAKERAREAEERAEQAEEKVEELQDELKEERETRAEEGAQDRKRLHEVEERLDSVEEGGSPDSNDETPTPESEEATLREPETPLEDIVQLPEHVVSESLSANEQRSRFVSKDVSQYSRSVPAGRAIKSSELRRVLSARDDGSCHTQTVQRVMQRLDDLGGDDVAIKETQGGQKVVVFTDDIVQRIQRYNESHTVVSQQEVST